MGTILSFRRVTPEELDRALIDSAALSEIIWRERPNGEPSGYLDKAWGGLYFLFEAAAVPVNLAYDGSPIGDEGTYFAWPAATVERVARVLRSTPFERLAAYYDRAVFTERGVYPNIWYEGSGALDYLRHHYTSLTRFFDTAARTGSAAIMHFG
ncbi:YfbM family protein [Nocardia sp. NPDC052566]|uniref:YfbM family protein n=1 Tax=Nocardia sp. NPDC052566 TaxID=3364330 RepID=UPI0037CC0845